MQYYMLVFMSMLMSHTSLHFIVLCFVLACARLKSPAGPDFIVILITFVVMLPPYHYYW